MLVTHNTAHYIAMHYLEFIQSLLDRGYQVEVAAPRDAAFRTLGSLGVRCHDMPLSRRGMNPFRELRSVVSLWRLARRIRPRILFNYSIKPVIYGSFVAGVCRVPYTYSMVTGLGYMFGAEGTAGRALKRLVIALYKAVLKNNRTVFFQNTHDRDMFVSHGLIDDSRTAVVNGTGIDLERFQPGAPPARPATFLLVSRMLWEKGVREFVSAAAKVRASFADARFQLLGPIDDNPSAIGRPQLEEWQRNAGVEYLGETTDVRPYLARATVFVLPSYYREGRARSILEAMAMGKPVITTDWPGCREPVKDGVSGFLVPIKCATKLAAAMERFLREPGLVEAMGRESRAIVEQEYDVHQVNRAILSHFPESV